ncbi:MAG: hypothetical protein VB089_19750 [Anaerolineaceae bacterium]|nr:hypothetical protein [Anaerolineaceae bacterium]
MESYTLSEWKPIVILGEQFHPADRKLLEQLRSDLRVEIDELKEGIRIRAKSWVGVIQFHHFQIQILPKLAGDTLGLVDMLEYTTGIRAFKHYSGPSHLDVRHYVSLLDLIIWLFCDACEAILAGGLLYDYEHREDSLTSLRGRLLIDRQLRRRFGQLDRLECRFEEHSSNIIENQILTLGLSHATHFAQDEIVRNRSARLWSIFSEACQLNRMDLSKVRTEIFYTRLNEHYRQAHQLAWFILDGLGIEDVFHNGDTPSFAFLLDMNYLFEQFLQRYLTETLAQYNLTVARQWHDRSIIWDLFHNHSYTQIIPDFLVSRDSSPQCIPIDAKYKLYDEHKIAISDITQVFLYAYAFNPASQPAAVLIYPSQESSKHRTTMRIQPAGGASGAIIHVLGLNIRQTLAEIHNQTPGLIAEKIKELF